MFWQVICKDKSLSQTGEKLVAVVKVVEVVAVVAALADI